MIFHSIGTRAQSAEQHLKDIDDNFKFLDQNKATEGDVTAAIGALRSDLDTAQTDIAGNTDNIDAIKTGALPVGRAATIDETGITIPPGKAVYWGWDAGGYQGAHVLPDPAEGGKPPAQLFFATEDVRWSGEVAGVYTLTLPHGGGGFPVGLPWKEDGTVYTEVFLTVQRDAANIYVRSPQKFAGYVVVVG
jgi:hypothetical protein